MAAIGVPQRDFLCPLAAGAGSSTAGSGQACLHSTGSGIPSSTVQVVPWQMESQPLLGKVLHLSGHGTPQVQKPQGSLRAAHVPTDKVFESLVHFPGAALPPGAVWHSQDGQPGTCPARCQEQTLIPAHPLGHFFSLEEYH